MIQQRVREGTQDWETVTEDLRQPGEKLLGKTCGDLKQGNETWWWNETRMFRKEFRQRNW